jgi:hypothetical protein
MSEHEGCKRACVCVGAFEHTSDTTETFAELRSFLRLVGHNLKIGSESLVVFSKPLDQWKRLDDFKSLIRVLVLKVLGVGLLVLAKVRNRLL